MLKRKCSILILMCTVLIIVMFQRNEAFASVKENFNFRNLTVEDGLSQSTIETIFQDSKGYIWFGSNDGLARYNGYDFKYYKYDKYNKNTISNNYIVDIIEDDEGRIWVATIKGLNCIDGDNIKRYYSDSDNGNLSHDNLWEIIYTNNKKLYVTSINGLNLYNEKTDSFERVLSKDELPSQFIYSIYEDNNDNIWIGTDKGLVCFDENLNKIKSYDKEIEKKEVYRIYKDIKNNMWISTLDAGLFQIDLNTNEVFNYLNDENNPNSLPSNTVRDTILDNKGNLWVGTNSGIAKFNYKTKEFTSFDSKTYDKNGLINDDIYSFCKDECGLIWIGTYGGVSAFNPNGDFSYYTAKPNDANSLSSNSIHGIYEDDNGNLYLGTRDSGINILIKDKNEFITLNTENSYLKDNTIEDITGRGDEVYVGTNSGLTILNVNSKTTHSALTKSYTSEDGIPSNKIRSLYLDREGYLWIGTSKGFAIMDTKTKKITNMNYLLKKALGISDVLVRSFYQDSDGEYYIGCFSEEGLIRLNPKNNSLKVYKNIEDDDTTISNDTIRAIDEDKYGNIVVGTSHGLNFLDKKTDRFTQYTERDGLCNNTIYGIQIDAKNYIWMSTNAGISRFSPKNKRFVNYSIPDGLQSNEFNGRSSFKSKSGIMYFGGTNGFNVFNPEKIHFSDFKHKINIDGFEVKGINSDSLEKSRLISKDNAIKISFFTNEFKNVQGTKYLYKLDYKSDGKEEDWEYLDGNTLLFANLADGKYSLKVKAITSNGIETSEKRIDFKVYPPLWRSKPALVIYVLLIIISICLHLNAVKKLDILVNDRTKELKVEMSKNKKLFEKIITLEQNKNSYFVNLSHELRTPLNVLLGINQVIEDTSKKGITIECSKLLHYMNMSNKNCNRLLSIINNIIDKTKLESGNYIINKKEHDIVYVVEETVLSMKDYIESKGIELIVDTTVEEKLVSCDKSEIERCVVNLVGNAYKFTPNGGKIEVLMEDLGDKFNISVIDTGVGISKENQKSVFDKFNQVIDKNSEVKGGSGLGLAITKQLVELHGGIISLESDIGKGCNFTISLPVE